MVLGSTVVAVSDALHLGGIFGRAPRKVMMFSPAVVKEKAISMFQALDKGEEENKEFSDGKLSVVEVRNYFKHGIQKLKQEAAEAADLKAKEAVAARHPHPTTSPQQRRRLFNKYFLRRKHVQQQVQQRAASVSSGIEMVECGRQRSASSADQHREESSSSNTLTLETDFKESGALSRESSPDVIEQVHQDDLSTSDKRTSGRLTSSSASKDDLGPFARGSTLRRQGTSEDSR